MSTAPLTTAVATQVLSFLPDLSVEPTPVNMTWTNLGPLTTAFQAPASCSTELLGQLEVIDNTNPEDESRYYECDLLNSMFPSKYSCQPSATLHESLWSSASGWWADFLSPGISCPPGYATAGAYTLSPNNVSATATSIPGYLYRTTGTHVFCCPRYGLPLRRLIYALGMLMESQRVYKHGRQMHNGHHHISVNKSL